LFPSFETATLQPGGDRRRSIDPESLIFMKMNLLIIMVAALATIGVQAQTGNSYPNERSPFYRPLTMTPAESEPSSGGGMVTENQKESGKEGGLSQEELAKLAQNPVANLMSFPFQNNFNFGVGPDRVTQYVMNFQPVIPITLTEDWNLITRWILPVIEQPSPASGIRSAFGLGDFNPSLFLSPSNPGKIIWGVGPTITFPTATDPMLGLGDYMLGPSAVALTIRGHWVLGALVNNQWAVGGWGPQNANRFLAQPFINYNLPNGWYLNTAPLMTANWSAGSEDRWTVPVGGGFGKIVKLGGKLPLNLQLGAYYNVVTPREGADWQLRFQIQVLFPKELLNRL
jgi:hypothetical protein